MARGPVPSDVSPESASSGNPDFDELGPSQVDGGVHPSDEQLAQQREDDAWRAEHPNEPLVREPVEGQGGESFAYEANYGLDGDGEPADGEEG